MLPSYNVGANAHQCTMSCGIIIVYISMNLKFIILQCNYFIHFRKQNIKHAINYRESARVLGGVNRWVGIVRLIPLTRGRPPRQYLISKSPPLGVGCLVSDNGG